MHGYLKEMDFEGLSPTGLARLATAVARPGVELADAVGVEPALARHGVAIPERARVLLTEAERWPRSAIEDDRARSLSAFIAVTQQQHRRRHWCVPLYLAAVSALHIALTVPGDERCRRAGYGICTRVISAAASTVYSARAGISMASQTSGRPYSIPGAVVTAGFEHPIVVGEDERQRAMLSAVRADPLADLGGYPSSLHRLIELYAS